ncbi:hypothetical protein GP486_006763 [Trichoglossum hirsutum]|uniref:CCHC-type domain-containing protein n=1 Tax=Trichoglossum hirsutum TaxID=265104 RepID=A0A9P8IGQ4_9PEZI|nr:hypothetical protein GP486_006763 [Trichoglossum hirsutum]
MTQICARLEKHDRIAKDLKEAHKATPAQLPHASKMTEREKNLQAARSQSSAELRCYNCGETGHIAQSCPNPKTECMKQAFIIKLAVLTACAQEEQEAENE